MPRSATPRLPQRWDNQLFARQRDYCNPVSDNNFKHRKGRFEPGEAGPWLWLEEMSNWDRGVRLLLSVFCHVSSSHTRCLNTVLVATTSNAFLLLTLHLPFKYLEIRSPLIF